MARTRDTYPDDDEDEDEDEDDLYFDDEDEDEDEYEDEDDSDSDGSEAIYASYDEWAEAYADGYFDDYEYEEIDGGLDYSGE